MVYSLRATANVMLQGAKYETDPFEKFQIDDSLLVALSYSLNITVRKFGHFPLRLIRRIYVKNDAL